MRGMRFDAPVGSTDTSSGRTIQTLRVEGRVALVYPERDLVLPQVRAFIDWMAPRLPVLFQDTASLKGDKRSEDVDPRQPYDGRKRRRLSSGA